MNYSKSSLHVVHHCRCGLEKGLEQYMITFSSLSRTCDITSQILWLLASGFMMYGKDGPGYASSGTYVYLCAASFSLI